MSGIIGPVIELSTLPQRHPVGDAMLDLFGAQLVYRLSVNPTQRPTDTLKIEITVNHIGPGSHGNQREELREVGWSALPGFTDDYLARVGRTVNVHRMTEDAAIGMMGLLINELEGMIVVEVLPIGSGPDYVIQLNDARSSKIEVSGIAQDLTGSKSKTRLAKKTDQVLKKNASGFVSITTFHHPTDGIVHSYLHHVAAEKRKRRGKRK